MPYPFLSLAKVTCSLGGAILLDGVSFDAQAGDYIAIVGPNGAGKTTLLRCLAQLITTWQGNIALDGVSVRSIPRRQLAQRLVFLSQSTGFARAATGSDTQDRGSGSGRGGFTVEQVVAMGRYPHQHPLAPMSSHDASVVNSAMEATGTLKFAQRSLETLSGGEQQKVFLAAAIAQEPEILLLDEPTTFLDYRHQREIRAVLRDLNHRGTTIIEVTHDLNTAALDANRAIALVDGQIAFSGTPAALMTPEVLSPLFGTTFTMLPHPERPISFIVPS